MDFTYDHQSSVSNDSLTSTGNESYNSNNSYIDNSSSSSDLIRSSDSNDSSIVNSSNTNITNSGDNNSKLISSKKFDFIPAFARNYLFYLLNIKNLSEKTVYEYYLDLRTFFRYIVISKNITHEDNFDLIDASNCPVSVIENLSLTEIYEYLGYIREGRDNETRARMRKVSSLKSFYKYLCKQAIINENPTLYLESPKVPKNLPVYLTLDESVKLLNTIDGPYKERNFAIITLFLNCGLRLSELVGINLSSINGNSLRVRGKGNIERIVYLNQSCVDAIVEYLKVRPDTTLLKDQNALFISREGRRISRRMVQTLVEKYIKLSGLDPDVYSTHKLRHTAATLMYQNGVDVRVLQQILGHANLGTTQIYTHISDKQLENALDSNPLNNKKIINKSTDS